MLLPIVLFLSQTFDDHLVTFTAQAETIDRALADLSQVARTPLTVSGPIATDIVVFRFDQVPLNQVLGKIAEVTTAEWRPTEHGFNLVRPHKIVDRIMAKRLQDARSDLTTAFQDDQNAIDSTGPLTEARLTQALKHPILKFNSFMPLQPDEIKTDLQTKPASRLLFRIAKGIDVDTLAALSLTEKSEIYATDPTRLQSRLDIDPSVLDDFVQEHNTMAATKTEVDPLRVGPGSSVLLSDYDDRRHLSTMPIKVILRIDGEAGYGAWALLHLHGIVYDSQGFILGEGDCDVAKLPESAEVGPFERLPKPPPESGPRLDVPDAIQILSKARDQTRHEVFPPALLAKLETPDKVEPLSITCSPILVEWAEWAHENLAACLNDAAGLYSVDPKIFIQRVKSHLEVANLVRQESDGWLTFKPKYPLETTDERFDRKAVAELISAAKRNYNLSLDDLAAYACHTWEAPNDSGMSLIDGGLEWADFVLQRDLTGMGADWDLLKFFGSLSPAQRDALTHGEKLDFSSISTEQQQSAISMLETYRAPQLEMAGNQAPYYFDPGSNAQKRSGNDLMLEASQSLANGLGLNGWLDLSKESDLWVGRTNGGEKPSEWYGLTQFVSDLDQWNSETAEERKSSSFAKLYFRTEETYRLKFNFAPGISATRSQRMVHDDPGGPVSPDHLPIYVRRLVDNFKNSRAGSR